MLKKCPKKFPNVRTKLGCLDKMSEVNFSQAETLTIPYLLFLKKQQNLKVSSAANCRWRFKG